MQETKKRSGSFKIIIFISVVLLLLILAGNVICRHYFLKKEGAPAYSSEAVAWNGAFMTDAEPGYMTVPGYGRIPLRSGCDTTQIALANPDTNECNFQFQLILKDTEEILYTSDLVAPGKAILEQKLNQAFEEGDYNLIIRINTFSDDGETTYTGTDVETVLHVFKG